MRSFVIFLSSLLMASCNASRSNQDFDAILETDSLQTQLFEFLKGDWSGYYVSLNISHDTVYYDNIHESIEYQLTGSKADSSLIKEINVSTDSVRRPLWLKFIIENTYTNANYVTVTTSLTERKYPFFTQFSLLQYQASERTLHFGEDVESLENVLSLPDGLIVSNILDDSLSWDAIDFTINTVTKDTAILKFETGMVCLGKDR